MKCQILLTRKKKKNIISLPSAEFADSMVSVKRISLFVLAVADSCMILST